MPRRCSAPSLAPALLPRGRRGRRRLQLDVDAFDEAGIAIREAADQVAQELPLLALLGFRAAPRGTDLAGNDTGSGHPVHHAGRAHVHDARAVLLEGEGAKVL